MKSNSKVFKIGVTGGIGSGKTTICKLIEKQGFPVFYSDLEAKSIMISHETVISKIKELFGENAYQNGDLNRPHLAQVAFNNPSLLHRLNEIVHPVVRESFEKFVLKNVHAKLVFNEAAILFETGAYKNFDFTILITAPEQLRIQRVSERDNITEQQVMDRMKNQWSDEEKKTLADYTIENDEQPLLPQLEKILVDLKGKL